ncbi:hypothetical protein [Psychrobacillus vulpis]|uniref:Uncharacterized protein n=1 Tax=Psychrobacillus vulpis TaxID=2325572 RepID=A0A544TV50_9BACI|nr:hypothetical protein [Psychrobacillus vulpis]TQR21327.1 hypothetical protein FG384_03745 [Psychrobacillus vulpis]
MNLKYFAEALNQSLQNVEKSVEHMELHTNMTKTQQLQIMQAILELSERIKLIETQIALKNNIH